MFSESQLYNLKSLTYYSFVTSFRHNTNSSHLIFIIEHFLLQFLTCLACDYSLLKTHCLRHTTTISSVKFVHMTVGLENLFIFPSFYLIISQVKIKLDFQITREITFRGKKTVYLLKPMLGDWKEKCFKGLWILAAFPEGSSHSSLFTSDSTLPIITTALGNWCSRFSTGTHRLMVRRYIQTKTHQQGGRGVFSPPSERTTKWTFLQLRSLNAVSHVVVTPNHKVIQLLYHNCNLINVMNHNAKLVCRTADMQPPWKDHWTPNRSWLTGWGPLF